MKLSQLSPEQKTRLLAELDGFIVVDYEINPFTFKADPKNYGKPHIQVSEAKDYPNSYDAIIPLVQKLSCGQRVDIAARFKKTSQSSLGAMLDLMRATPSQLCDAVLVATGKAIL